MQNYIQGWQDIVNLPTCAELVFPVVCDREEPKIVFYVAVVCFQHLKSTEIGKNNSSDQA